MDFRFFCYDGDDEASELSVATGQQIAHELINAARNPYSVVTPAMAGLFKKYAEALDCRDRTNAPRVRKYLAEGGTHVVSGYLHAPFLHHYLDTETRIVIAKPDEPVQPDVELTLRARQNSLDSDTAVNLTRRQILFWRDVLANGVNIAAGIPRNLSDEHKLKTTAGLYEELFPDLPYKYGYS